MGLFGNFGSVGGGERRPAVLFEPVSLTGDFYGDGVRSRVSDRAPRRPEEEAIEQLRAAIADDPRLPTPEAKAFAMANPRQYVETSMAQMDRPGPDYAGHNAMHGRGPDGALPRKERSGTEKILRTVGPMLLAMLSPTAGASIIARRKAKAEARHKADSAFADHSRTINAMMRQGMTADQAELAATNLESFGTNFNSRFGTDTLAKGSTRYTPNLDGTRSTYTAPELVTHGADSVLFDPQNPPRGPGSPATGISPAGAPPLTGPSPSAGASPPSGVPFLGAGGFSLRTEAEQFADSFGYPRGSDEWRKALLDYRLTDNGPTAFGYRKDLEGVREAGRDRRAAMRPPRAAARVPGQRPPSKSSVVGRLLDKKASGQALSPAEQSVLDQHGGGRAESYPNGTIIEMPDGTIKEKKGGRWVRSDG